MTKGLHTRNDSLKEQYSFKILYSITLSDTKWSNNIEINCLYFL